MDGTVFATGRKGLELEAPEPGDVVTVRLRPPSQRQPAYAGPSAMDAMFGSRGREYPEWESPQHYRHTNFWRVLAVNGSNAVVQQVGGHDGGRTESWTVSLHRWFEASDLCRAWLGGRLREAENRLEEAEAREWAAASLPEKRLDVERHRRALAELGEC